MNSSEKPILLSYFFALARLEKVGWAPPAPFGYAYGNNYSPQFL